MFVGFISPESNGIRVMAPIGPKTARTIKLVNTKELFIRFYFANSSSSSNYKGYVITYQPIGNLLFSLSLFHILNGQTSCNQTK